jgi:hypothetical protein
MSWVTNILLNVSPSDEDNGLIEQVNRYFQRPEFGIATNLVAVDSPTLPQGWYGGNHIFEASLYVGAFNYFDLKAFITYLKSLPWHDPDWVQLIVKDQEDVKFRTVDIFSTS